ncbi:unnamed protein product [Paramecium primaurelia]|uniref:Uncharacterized protein n=1 Tax=Paramecium primaurelia TaxID=5886 RepID=A0A8S1PIZ9_PARPR|nr:unnamed protein product [Paramecium primaurelia]
MIQYIQKAELFLPQEIRKFISYTKQTNKSVMDAENYSIDNHQQYSQLFKGQENLETIKRKSILLNQSCQKEIQDFLSKYQFTQQLNITKIFQQFYSEKYGCCFINLNQISDNLPNYLQNTEIEQFNDQKLNQTIDELTSIYIEYIKGQFIQESIIQEFVQNYQNIFRKVYYSIIQAAKKQQREIYNKLIKQIKQFYKNQLNNPVLDGTCTIIKENKIPLFQIKDLINNLFAQNYKYLHDELQNLYNFKLSYVILSRYVQKTLDHQLFKLKSSLQIFMKNEKVHQELKLKSNQLFYEYFQKKDFLLIKNKEFATQLFYLLLQTDLESKEMLNILDLLSQYTEIPKINSSQDAKYTIKQLKNIYFKQIEQAKLFWKNDITEQQNLQLIFDLFIFLNDTFFVNDQLLFSQYQSVKKNILMKIINLMKEGYYGYFNSNLIKRFEIIIEDIRNQIFNQLEKRKQNMELSVVIQGHQFFIKIYDQYNYTQEFLQEQFYQRNTLFYRILNFQTNSQIRYIKNLMSEIQKNYLNDICIPERIEFEIRSSELEQSSVVTLFISGFTDLEVQNTILEGLKDQNIIILNWNNLKKENNITVKLMMAVQQILQLQSPLKTVVNALKAYANAPFQQSYQEAKLVGKYLAHLLIEKKIFGDRQINIIAHSVGSTVMYEMMKELDNRTTTQTINEILILGGIVDIRKLKKRRWNCVEGRIYNVYSKNDMILKLIYNSFRWIDQLCGLNEVELGYRRIENYNMSNLIKGHKDYGIHIKQILIQTDFLQYLRFLYE